MDAVCVSRRLLLKDPFLLSAKLCVSESSTSMAEDTPTHEEEDVKNV